MNWIYKNLIKPSSLIKIFSINQAHLLLNANNSSKRNVCVLIHIHVTLRAGTGNETGTGNEQLQYTFSAILRNHFHLMMAKKFVTHKWCICLRSCYAYAITITIDSFPFLISWTHSFSSAFYFIAFSLSFRLHLLFCVKLTTFFLLKLIILTLGQLHPNILLLLLLLLLFFYAL